MGGIIPSQNELDQQDELLQIIRDLSATVYPVALAELA